jgi:hypothetical protein
MTSRQTNEQKNLSMKTAKKKKLGRRKRPWPFKGFPLQQSCSLVLFFLSHSYTGAKERKKERKRTAKGFVLFV